MTDILLEIQIYHQYEHTGDSIYKLLNCVLLSFNPVLIQGVLFERYFMRNSHILNVSELKEKKISYWLILL